jgi:rhodanese-related sulfurtransferase
MSELISCAQLRSDLESSSPPLVIDVRRKAAYLAATDTVRGALRRDPQSVTRWADELPRSSRVVVYCAHGHEVSQSVAAELSERGVAAQYLEGGLESGWRAGGGALDEKTAGVSSLWVTRERPKIDRIACPWLIRRFIDADAEFLYVPADQVLDVAAREGARSFDAPAAEFTHRGEQCTFEALIEDFRLDHDPALARLARIVHAADIESELHTDPAGPGLLAIGLGGLDVESDDHRLLERATFVYDALYAWCAAQVATQTT